VQTQFINPDNHSPDKPYDQAHPSEKYFSAQYPALLERVPQVFLILGACTLSLQLTASLLMFKAPTKAQELSDAIVNEGSVADPEQDGPLKNSLGVE